MVGEGVPTGRRWLLAAACLAAGVVFHGWYAGYGIALFDQGILLDGAWRVLRGEVFGRDFVAPYGPVRYWVTALWMAQFGVSLASVAWLFVALQALAGALVFLAAARRGTILGAAVAAAMLAVAHGSLHKSFLMLAVAAVCVAASAGAGSPRPRVNGLLGAVAGLAFLCRYDVGGFALAALVAACGTAGATSSRARLHCIGALLAGFASAVGICALLLLGQGMDFAQWWDLTWHRIAVQERIRLPFPWPVASGGGLAPTEQLIRCAALGLAPLVHLSALATVALRWRRHRAMEGDAARVAIAGFGLLLLNQARLIPSTNHLFQAALPLYLVLADLLARAGRGRLLRAAQVAILGLLILWVHHFTRGPYPGSYTVRFGATSRLEVPSGRAGVMVPTAQAQSLRAVVADVLAGSEPGQPLLVSPGLGLLGFLCDRPLCLPAEASYYYFEPRFQRPAIAAIEGLRPPRFVAERRRVATFSFQEAAPQVLDHVLGRYRQIADYGEYQVFRRAK